MLEHLGTFGDICALKLPADLGSYKLNGRSDGLKLLHIEFYAVDTVAVPVHVRPLLRDNVVKVYLVIVINEKVSVDGLLIGEDGSDGVGEGTERGIGGGDTQLLVAGVDHIEGAVVFKNLRCPEAGIIRLDRYVLGAQAVASAEPIDKIVAVIYHVAGVCGFPSCVRTNGSAPTATGLV